MSSSRKQLSTERRPRMLKDFLIDNDSNSCSSSGFESFPRRRSSIRSLIQNDVANTNNDDNKASLLRSRSKAAASKTVSAFIAIINTVKSIQLNDVVKVVKPPSILPRISLSRKLPSEKRSTPTRKEIINDIKITVRVKDIVRWKSFRDLVLEEKPQPQPSDLASSPDHQCTGTTTTTIGSSTTNSTPSPCSSSSNGSSWCESDFTSEYCYLPPWTRNSAENDAHGCVGEKYLPRVGSGCDSTRATVESAVGPKELHGEEKEQLSPVSVLNFELQEDEDHSGSSFDQTLANPEKWMSMEENDGDDSSAEEEEGIDIEFEVEEKAKLLLNQIKTTISRKWNCKDSTIVWEQLLLDFLVDELSTKRNNQSRINEMVRRAEAWIKGEDGATTLLIDDAGECVRDMDMKESWNKFEGEQEEVSLQIENTLLNLLLDDLLHDL